MSTLNEVEKRYLERVLGMGSGYVLDYTDATFGEFFKKCQIDIHGPKYRVYGTSKAKKMRAFWELEADKAVADVLGEMIDSYEAICIINKAEADAGVLRGCLKRS